MVSKLRLTAIGLMSLLLLIAPMSISAKSIESNNQSSDNIQQYEIIEGGQKDYFLGILEESNLYEGKVSHQSIDSQNAMVANMGNHDYEEEVIMINAAIENLNNAKQDVIYAFIGKDSKKVLKLSHFEIGDETTNYKDYDEFGTLMIHNKYSTEDLKDGNPDNPIMEYTFNPGNSIQVSDFWINFACNFGGLYSCSLGCLAGLIGGPVVAEVCVTMCSIVWGSALC